MIFETAAAKAVATTVLAGSATLGVGVAANDCPSGQEMTIWGCAVVETAPDETIRRGTGTISATTVAVTFRDGNGNRTDSGLGAADQFEWLGGRKQGKNGDGQLIEVKQITTGKGGWGPRYEGWIPAKYTQIPSMFD